MDDAKLKNTLPALLTIPERDAEALLRLGDGDAVLLYLYVLRHGGRLDLAAAARELGRSDRDMSMAADRLLQLGLLASGGGVAAPAAGDPPSYDARDIARRAEEDPRFGELVGEVQLALGKTLTRTDLERLFAIYEDLGLPPEVILLVVQYCKEETLRRYGPGRTVGLALIYQVAREWFEKELMTYELAEQWLARCQEHRSHYGRLRGILGIRDRELNKFERGYLDAWMDMGFGPEAIEMAVSRTVDNTGGMKWKYADAILRSWDERKLYTPEEIAAGDRRQGGKPPALPQPPRDDSQALAQIRRLQEQMKQGKA